MCHALNLSPSWCPEALYIHKSANVTSPLFGTVQAVPCYMQIIPHPAEQARLFWGAGGGDPDLSRKTHSKYVVYSKGLYLNAQATRKQI